MSRKKNDFIDALLRAPWWASVLVAGLLYVLLPRILPMFAGDNPVLRPIFASLAQASGYLAFFILCIAPFAAMNQWQRRRLLDRQKDLDSLRALDWRAFEQLVGEALRRQGYHVLEQGGGGPDGGVDLRARRQGKSSVVQCKRWRSQSVGVALIRELYGVITADAADAGIFVTVGSYTADARAFARGKPITLIDGPQLLDWVQSVQQQTGPISQKTVMPVKNREPLTSAESAPACPRCGNAMVRRTARQGAQAGTAFWGCTAYPRCRGTVGI